MQPVTNFSLISSTIVDNTPNVTFGFTKPTGASGYVLYLSSTGTVFTVVDIKSDVSMGRSLDLSTRDINGTTQFTYVMPITYPEGQIYYFRVSAVNIYNEYSIFSDTLSIVVPCSKPETPVAAFDNYTVNITWGDNTQPQFDHYEIRRYILDQVTDSTLSGSILQNTLFVLNAYIVVYDTYLNSQYEGFVTSTGSFDLLNKKITNSSDVSSNISSTYSYDVYVIGALDTTWTVTSTGLVDTSITSPIKYAYAVYNVDSVGTYSAPAYTHTKTQKLSSTYPIIRNPTNSSTGILSDTIWPTIRNALIGSDYYNQTTWAIPFSQTTAYSIKGICWVADCNVDLFINNIYHTTTSTDSYGVFTFVYKFPRGNTTISVQARDKANIQFSQPSMTIPVQTLNMYTWFYAIGTQFNQMLSGIQYLFNGLSIATSTPAQFADNYQPLVDLVQDSSENTTSFNALATGLFSSFTYVGFTQGLNSVLDAFKSYDTNIINYEVYSNNSFETSNQIPDVYAVKKMLLPRNIYTYAITALKTSTGNTQETTSTEYIIDTRFTRINSYYMNVLKWEPVVNATHYRIYRKTSYTITSTGYIETPTEYIHLIDTPIGLPRLIFADTGELTALDSKVPPLYNFSTLDEVTGISHVVNINTSFYKNESLKKTHFVNIILYMKGSTWPSTLTFQRLFVYITKMIPPEDSYTVTICNNEQSNIYDFTGTAI